MSPFFLEQYFHFTAVIFSISSNINYSRNCRLNERVHMSSLNLSLSIRANRNCAYIKHSTIEEGRGQYVSVSYQNYQKGLWVISWSMVDGVELLLGWKWICWCVEVGSQISYNVSLEICHLRKYKYDVSYILLYDTLHRQKYRKFEITIPRTGTAWLQY
jgi:hypothetical protein